MCTTLFLLDAHPTLLLLLLFNRDEFYARPTDPSHFWASQPDILAGRDAMRGGTWLGVTRRGRWALLTNFREPLKPPPGSAAGHNGFPVTTNAPSRGELTTDFLSSDVEPLAYLESLRASDYMGVNLAVGDLRTGKAAFLCNRDGQPARPLEAGAYGLSNGFLNQWPKVEKGVSRLQEILAEAGLGEGPGDGAAAAAAAEAAAAEGTNGTCAASGGARCDGPGGGLPWERLFGSELMGDPARVEDPGEVPLTGVGRELDELLSARFVMPFEMQPGQRYGTRSQTILAVWRDGRAELRERFYAGPRAGAAPATAQAGADAAVAADPADGKAPAAEREGDSDTAGTGEVQPGPGSNGSSASAGQQPQQQREGGHAPGAQQPTAGKPARGWGSKLRALLQESSAGPWLMGGGNAALAAASAPAVAAAAAARAGSEPSGSGAAVDVAPPPGSSSGQVEQERARQAAARAPPSGRVCCEPVGLEARPSPGPSGPSDEWLEVRHEFTVPVAQPSPS